MSISEINSQVPVQQYPMDNVAAEDNISQIAENRLQQINQVKKSSLDGRLHIVKISEQQSRLLRVTASLWQRQAREMKASPQNIKQEELIYDSSAISCVVADQLKQLSKAYEYYVCKDNNNVIQGIIILNGTLDENELVISFLVTNPDNIRCPGNPKDGQVYGSGTLMMDFAIKRAAELGKKKIGLSPTKTSIEFYIKKLGFTPIASAEGEDDSDDECDYLEKVIA